ncbi:MAG: hypothetical protein ABWK15_04885 [Dissulfuribacterales bacterium]
MSAVTGKPDGRHGFLCVAGSLYLAGAVRERLITSGFSPFLV